MAEPEFDLSVVIPARNESAYVERTLTSVYEQDHPRARREAIVVINGCTDDTGDVVRRWAASHTDLKVSLLESDPPGQALARNAGAAAAEAPTVLFLDADSQMTPGLTQAILRSVASGTVISSVRIKADSKDLLDQAFYWIIEAGKVVLRANANLFFVDRAFFLSTAGYDPNAGFAEDLDFLQRVKRSGSKVRHMRNPAIATSARRLHEGPLRLGWLVTLLRWTAIRFGIGKRWRY